SRMRNLSRGAKRRLSVSARRQRVSMNGLSRSCSRYNEANHSAHAGHQLGQIVFATQAGALFGYSLLWTILLGTIAIILYVEMCGRVAAVTSEAVFAVVRSGLGKGLGMATLVSANLLGLISCAAMLGAIGIV